jgi:hypothetical protein
MPLRLLRMRRQPARGRFGSCFGAAQARYTFITVLDSEPDGLVPTRYLAINTLGVVAVTVPAPKR